MNRIFLLLFSLVFLAACEGPLGPEGPPGPPGGGTRLVFSGQLDAMGNAAVALPIAAGTIADPPVIACYVAQNAGDPFVVVSSSGMNQFCGFFGSAGPLTVLLSVENGGHWHYRIVIVH